MSNNKINKVIDLYNELIMEQGDDTLKTIINSNDFKAKLLAASGQKKLKKSKDPNSPKKPTTAWLLFCNETRPTLKEANPTLKMSEITSLMSPMWAELQESKDPDDVAKVAGYTKIVDAERSIYKAAKDKVEAEKPKKIPRNAYQLFMMNERTKPKPEGETFGATTSRISKAWGELKETDPEKIEELKAEVKRLRAEADESSASETEVASETEATSETEANEQEPSMCIEDILQKMHEEEDDDNRSVDEEGQGPDDIDAVLLEEKPKPKPKGRGKAKPKADEEAAPPKQKRPRCKKKKTMASA